MAMVPCFGFSVTDGLRDDMELLIGGRSNVSDNKIQQINVVRASSLILMHLAGCKSLSGKV